MAIVEWLSAQQLSDQISMVGVAVGALGLLGLFLQLRQQSRQTQTSFEDAFDERYRQVVAAIPTKAMLGEDLTEEEFSKSFDDFYRYIDLCNEQTFLALKKRIRRKTFEYWRDGICGNLSRPAFRRAWEEISTKAPDDFDELRLLLRQCRGRKEPARH